ncbi:MAG: right-handed parallel beta-helix repeat-containing protein [Deltaproteobacteria bacterium]|nr:right-handed parallel beta-helix repeat-containing protein [Deltaproteobacteria bacterium]
MRTLGRGAAALLVSTTLVTPRIAASATVTCGMVVEDQIVLDRDLRCAGPALVIRNPRTVVQLNGHVLESSRPCHDAGSTVGIVVEPTADRANILGPGIVRGFATGITIDWAPQVQLRDLRVTDSCAFGIAVRSTTATRARDLVLDRNGDGGDSAGAIRVEHARRFALVDSDVLLNDAGANGAAIDLRSCENCRIGGNRVVANHGAGIRLDVESQANEVERNLILGQRPSDVVDQGSDNLITLNGFDRGDGVDPPPLWPLLSVPASPAPGIAGCGTMHDTVGPRATVTITCPQDVGLRAVRNSVVTYRLLNPFNTSQLFRGTCNPGIVHPAAGSTGGSVRCTNGDSLWPAVLEVTCCLN